MELRGNLFLKIFIGFWLATMSILVSWMLSSHYFDTRHGDGEPSVGEKLSLHAGPPPRFMLRTLYNLQHLPESKLRDLVLELQARRGVELFLLSENGSDLFDRDVPASVARLANDLVAGQRRVMEQVRGKHLVGHLLFRDDGTLLRVIFVIPRPVRGLLRALGENLWLRLTLAVLISGVVCYLLSLLMTRRLKELGKASRQLADGNLDTRLSVRDRGGDETDELARDFNTMAAQLQTRINAQKRLLGDVSHELRSPLARLRVALALAQDDPENLQAHLKRIDRETERLDELIDQLLSTGADLTSLDTHIDLVTLLRELCSDADFEGRGRSITLAFDTAVEQAVVRSTADLLHKCFENILRNALAHSPRGGTIGIELNAEEGGYLIAIEDQGPGVPEEQLESIFSEFYRVDSARTREAGGYGLGLAIARRAVERHGGSIKAENTGRGLRVTVNLPAGT